jgi:quercetin dioxygenase-like cupin family protein
MTSRRAHILILAAAPLLVATGATVGWAAGSAEPPVVVREPLAEAKQPRGVDGRTLGLSRVTVMPDAELPAHTHPGTQVAYVEQGTLTYTVNDGRVSVMRGSSDDPTVVRRIRSGETGKIRTGQWIVEQPNDHHQAANRGDLPVVIFTATLLRKGFPTAIPD